MAQNNVTHSYINVKNLKNREPMYIIYVIFCKICYNKHYTKL